MIRRLFPPPPVRVPRLLDRQSRFVQLVLARGVAVAAPISMRNSSSLCASPVPPCARCSTASACCPLVNDWRRRWFVASAHQQVCFGNSYNDDERCVGAGYDNGDVKVFDLRTSQVLWETNVGNGVVSVEFDRKDIEMNKLCVTSLESKFRVYDMRTNHPEQGCGELAHRTFPHIAATKQPRVTIRRSGALTMMRSRVPKKNVGQWWKRSRSGVRLYVASSRRSHHAGHCCCVTCRNARLLHTDWGVAGTLTSPRRRTRRPCGLGSTCHKTATS